MPGTSDTPGSGALDPAYAATPARRVFVDPQGPVVVEGPVEIALDDRVVVRSDRFMVAVCTCRRSRTYPWCDTSHRRRESAVSPPKNRKPR
ncbi:CDGSH iron-sulfur domain-containing protein [Streptomyces sp. NPDC012746]|uniref:CDGSH iron-sulfur domain-containing protein n=1 Tax=Streptomyces sp. NPDC012746 TaxID=3364845 RepID=UPI003676B497